MPGSCHELPIGTVQRRNSTDTRIHGTGDDEISRFRDPQMNEDYDVTLRLTSEDRREVGEITSTAKSGRPCSRPCSWPRSGLSAR